MSFCWFTSFIGYPNFFKRSGNPRELARSYLTLASASLEGESYSASKGLFPALDHAQVETKKAAFQEYGLLYVVPRSDRISLTPAGRQVYDLVSQPKLKEKNRRAILLMLGRALARYQFNNPIPVGGSRRRGRALSSDVLPYLSCYYLMHMLGGLVTVSEVRGMIFGLQLMKDIPSILRTINVHRERKQRLADLECLPSNRRTAENLKIYFMSHLGLDFEIIRSTMSSMYGYEEQSYEFTEHGYELTITILDEQWPNWRRGSEIPRAREYKDIKDYFTNGIGQLCPESTVIADSRKAEEISLRSRRGLLDIDEVDNLKDLPIREFQEGRRKLIRHVRMEKTRNPQLIRDAKKYFKKRNGRLHCEVCGFDFGRKYGSRGRDYIEAHHKIPLSELEENVTLTVNDVAMVCSNCHRMLHRPPWISIEELSVVITKPSQAPL
jgi:ribosomal protein L44E